jgi:CHAD domain-containing protein
MELAGAQPVDQIPTLVRALGPSALAPWDLAAPEIGKRPTAGELVRARLIDSAANLVDHVAAVVLDEDLEGVHQARVGIRRLRSDLRTVSPMLHMDAVRPLRRELQWLMGLLGDVRDLDVILARLRADVSALDRADRAAADAVLAQAMEDRGAAYQRLREELRTPRCAALFEDSARIAAAPPFNTRAAKLPASEVLPRLVRKPLRGLLREVSRLGDTPDDQGLHQVRIKVKRVRYATELAAPSVGKDARRAARCLARVQDVLGEHNDARTAEIQLRMLGQRTGASGAWAAGLLGGLELAAADECRERFLPVWEQASASKRWTWTE